MAIESGKAHQDNSCCLSTDGRADSEGWQEAKFEALWRTPFALSDELPQPDI